MFQLLWLVAAIPFVSAVLLALFGSRLPRKLVAQLGALIGTQVGRIHSPVTTPIPAIGALIRRGLVHL